jgi:HEAT repeat protein
MTIKLKDYLAQIRSGDDERAEAVAVGYGALPLSQVPDALAELSALLASPDANLRWWAVRALSQITDARVPSILLDALGDTDASVRQCAALGLRLHPEGNAVPSLVRALMDEDPLVVGLAVDALVEIGSPAVPALLDVLDNGPQAARLMAVRALAGIGDQRSIPSLFAALEEGSALLEYWAAEGLERMGVGMVFFTPE